MKSMTCLFAIILVIAVGCDSPDERLVHQLADTSQEVVRQRQEVARTQHELAEGSKQLVNAIAESRHEHNELQRDLQQQRDNLESERKAIATERRFESLIAPAIQTTGVLLVAALPLVLCWYLLHGLRTPDEDISEVLIQNFIGVEQLALPTTADRQRIERETPPALVEDPPF